MVLGQFLSAVKYPHQQYIFRFVFWNIIDECFFIHYYLIQVPGVYWKTPQNIKSEVKEMNNNSYE